ncbi:alpha/beta fold hydrolase [Fodinicola acaciae]|uniref:alpha/beta fold hydrolase n=1 Tax=Fodinicola acaciae TaxID=2681555 RepID=UPI0013D5A483|nr:alpha/beta fold hydrolase [Fodinicola acaciae]
MYRVEDLVYERRGTGTPLVLLHGIGHRWQAWKPVLDLLAEQHDVWAIDLPGFGKSAPPDPDRPYNMLAAVDTFLEIADQLGLSKPHLAGNSLGGALGLEVASRGCAASMTALSPAGFFGPAGRVWAIGVLSNMRRSAMSSRSRDMLVGNPRLRLAGASLLYGRPSTLDIEEMRGDLESMAHAPAFDAVASAGRNYRFAAPPPTVPTTVAWGTRDRILWPRQAKVAARALPDARHVPLPGCGHVPMQDDPGLVARTILATCRRADLAVRT